METALGLFGMVVWIVSVIGIAAGITYVVVKISPGNDDLKPKPPSEP